jgi:predicted nucleic acid-binding protein
MYLLDTVVLSEIRKHRRDANVVAWITSVAEIELYISVASIVEIQFVIERQLKRDPAFAAALAGWLDTTLRVYGERVLPVTAPIARRWGRLAAGIGNRELDLAIAATALEQGLTVVTRNVSHFEPTGVTILNPFDARAKRGR